MTALLLDGVTKDFSDKRAVDNLSFAVQDGEVFGFLGGNGAGKTTSLRMVLDIIRPSAGRIEVLGRPPGRENGPELGFLPEERGLYRTMTAVETITYFGRLKGMRRADARQEAQRFLDRFGLGGAARTRIDRLSKGMAQKVQLATAIVNKPALLILDEPFSGLDPVNQGLLEAEIQLLAREGSTVIFSTHVMQHAERLCDRLLLLAQGRKAFEGTQDQARALLPVRLSLVSRTTPVALPGVIAAEPGERHDDWTRWDVRLEPGADPADLLQACTERGFALRGFEQSRPSLHDVFLHVVGGGEKGA
jgi:ABC-2 type transport system ATP-binding protein